MIKKASLMGMVVVLALAVFMLAPAKAALVTYDVTFTAQHFSKAYEEMPSVPTDPVTGEFTITLDPTQTYLNETAGITLKSLNIDLGSPLAFNYGGTQLAVGGSAWGVDTIQGGPDFYFYQYNFPNNFSSGLFAYSTSDSNGAYITQEVSGTVTVVPLPPAGLLLGSGLLGLGAVGWRRRQVK